MGSPTQKLPDLAIVELFVCVWTSRLIIVGSCFLKVDLTANISYCTLSALVV